MKTLDKDKMKELACELAIDLDKTLRIFIQLNMSNLSPIELFNIIIIGSSSYMTNQLVHMYHTMEDQSKKDFIKNTKMILDDIIEIIKNSAPDEAPKD